MNKKIKLDKMTEKACLAEIEKNSAKRADLFKQKEPIDRSLVRLAGRNKKLSDRITKIKTNRKRTDWVWLLHEDGSGLCGMEKYHLRELKLRKLGLGTSGYFPKIQQSKVRVSLIKNDSTSLPKTLKSLTKVLPFILPSEDGYKVIDIFNYTLSAGGAYDLLVDESKDEYKIRFTRYHNPEIIHRFKTLKDALGMIQDKYYYEDLKKEESDYDDDGSWDNPSW